MAVKNETIKYLTLEQVEKFLSKISNKRDKTLFSLMYLYGLRREEAADLEVDDIKLEDNRIYIRALKGGVSGEYYLNKEAKRLLVNYLANRDEIIVKRKIYTNVLFISRNGGKLSGTQIARLFIRYAIKANFPEDKHHPHTLRHSIAVHMADSNIPPEHAQVHLRHRKIESTMVYYQITRRHEVQQAAFKKAIIAKV